MTFIIFLIILAVLIFVHELGHFLVAKLSGIRVDEFALGFPPTLYQKKVGETVYKLNLIPFGGYVSIFGENPTEESLTGSDSSRSITSKSRPIQAAVLIAGIVFNIIFAWILISGALTLGISPLVSFDANSDYLKDAKVLISQVVPASPADKSGIKVGDVIVGIQKGKERLEGNDLQVSKIQTLISEDQGEILTFSLNRSGVPLEIKTVPVPGIINDKAAVGIAMESAGIIKVPFYKAPIEGLKVTYTATVLTAQGLFNFIGTIVHGQAHFDQVSGPVGIVGMVGSASKSGFAYLLFFTSLISINLAVINLMPFPALDGGRLLFVLIESITRKPIPTRVANTLNATGFVLLILLMIVITYHDLSKLFFK